MLAVAERAPRHRKAPAQQFFIVERHGDVPGSIEIAVPKFAAAGY
jgi:hypothetical protein